MADAVDAEGAAGRIRIADAFRREPCSRDLSRPNARSRCPGPGAPIMRSGGRRHGERLDPRLLELVPPLSSFVPPAKVIDKMRYSAFAGSALHTHLRERGADTLIVTGSETDVCVLATVLDAVDFGYRVILVRDAICSSSDAGHDAMLEVYHRRYSLQIETADAQDVLRHWQG